MIKKELFRDFQVSPLVGCVLCCFDSKSCFTIDGRSERSERDLQTDRIVMILICKFSLCFCLHDFA